jgi:GTPase SAR1 family protein
MEQEVSILLLGDADVGKTTFLSYVLCAFSKFPLYGHSDSIQM